MNVDRFHRGVAREDLNVLLTAMRHYTAATGTLGSSHPLTEILQRLTEWIDAYDQGTATRAGWGKVVSAAIEAEREIDSWLYDRQRHNDPEWQFCKQIAAESLHREAEKRGKP